MRILVIAFSIFLNFAALCAENDATDARQKGLAALTESQTDPDKIVKAATLLVAAVDAFEKAGDDKNAQEMNSYLYWCKKKMNLAQIEVFNKSGTSGKKIAQRLEKAVTPLEPASADAFIAAADTFAAGHPDDHFLVAIRYFEVAERFKGTDASLKAQEISLREMQLVAVEKPTQKSSSSPEGTKLPSTAAVNSPAENRVLIPVGVRRQAEFAPPESTDPEVNAALDWLARHQEADGHWDVKKWGAESKTDTACAGFAVWAFSLAGHSENTGKYQSTVKRAVTWLKSKQALAGCCWDTTDASGPRAEGYCHAIAGTALIRAAAFSKNPDTLKAAQQVVNYSTKVQQSMGGGFRYHPRMEGDLSVTGWYIHQLATAKAAGFIVDSKSVEKAAGFHKSLERPAEHGSTYWYTLKDAHASQSLTMIGISCRAALGLPLGDAKTTVDALIEKSPPKWNANSTGVDMYYWFYGTLAANLVGGETTLNWNYALKPALKDHQSKNGDDAGSWPKAGAYSSEWGKVGQTALACIILCNAGTEITITPEANLLTQANPIVDRNIPDADAHQTIPTPEKLKVAETTIRDILKDEFKKTGAVDQLALSSTLSQQAASTKNDPATRYQLLIMAIELSSRNSALDKALSQLDTLKASYAIDALKFRTKILSDVAKGAKSKQQFAEVARGYLALATDLATNEDFSSATSACSSAQQNARSAQDMALYSTATTTLADFSAARSAYDRTKIAREKLAATPNDPEANLILGKYYCLTASDWNKGLSLLTKSSDEKWKNAATIELSNPGEAEGQMALADMWYEIGTPLNKSEQNAVRAHAKSWYERVESMLDGLNKIRVEKRIQELRAMPSPTPAGVSPTPTGVSEDTKKALPTDEELKALRKSALQVKNEPNRKSDISKQIFIISDRLKVSPKHWSDADYKARVDALEKLVALYAECLGGRVGFSFENTWKEFTTSAATPEQFAQRLSSVPTLIREKEARTQVRFALHEYIANHNANFPTPASKIQFCEWLKSRGANHPVIDEYKKDLQTGNDPTTGKLK